MKKKPTKAWPSQFLVLWRTTLDDIPLLLTPDITYARVYAKGPIPEADLRAAERAMGLDRCSPVNITIVSFKNGRPYAMKVVRDVGDNEPVEDAKPRHTRRKRSER